MESAVGVVDHHARTGPEYVRREHQRADHIVGDAATGIPHDMRVAQCHPEHPLGV
ncbi:MAG: hypothetical protein AMXMBFR23_01990 [Chloroflexota bacterium]